MRPPDERFARGGVSIVHVEDVAETIATNLFRDEAGGTVAMLADPEYVTFRELAEVYTGIARRHGYTVAGWSVPDGLPESRDGMFRFDTSVAVQRLGFASEAGRDRFVAKVGAWFAAEIAP
jgi:nucleoside-diphosphate-sugar epimerase